MKKIYLIVLIMLSLVLKTTAQVSCTDKIFVTNTGSGSGLSPNSPCSFATALTLVTASRNHVMLAAGNYTITGKVNIASNTILDGRYTISATNWVKSSANTTSLTITPTSEIDDAGGTDVRNYIAMEFLNVSNIYIKDINIINNANVSGTYGNRGRNAYGVYTSNSSNYYFTRTGITSANASNGANGANGANGLNAQNGYHGHDGDNDDHNNCNDGSAYGGLAGHGGRGGGLNNGGSGAQQCNNELGGTGGSGTGRNGSGGGGGGSGGRDDGSLGGRNGGNGGTSSAGGGGYRGSGSSGGNGGNGSTGGSGGNGSTSTTIPSYSFQNYFRPAAQSGTGGNGTGGRGGGGGGGGRAQQCWNCNDGSGGGGGGGGGGGQAGAGSTGGWGGGGSFGIYTNGGSNKNLLNVVFTTRSAGAGGSAGTRGNRGNRGTGAQGGQESEVGNGGTGGTGGYGGYGGTGANGRAGIYLNTRDITTYTGTTIPNPTTLTTRSYGNCTNSVLEYTKTSGSWSGVTFVRDLNASTTSFTNSSNAPDVYYTSTGHKNVTVGGSNYRNFNYIGIDRAAPVITLDNTTICSGGTIAMTATIWGTELTYNWQIYLGTSATGTPIYSSSLATPTSSAITTPGDYLIKYRVVEECCGESVPAYATFTVNPDPTIVTAADKMPNSVFVCAPDVINLANPSGVTDGISPYTYEYSTKVPSGSYSTYSATNFVASEAGNNSIRVRVAADASKGCDASDYFQADWIGNDVPVPGNVSSDQNICYGEVPMDFTLGSFSSGTVDRWEVSTSPIFAGTPTPIAVTSPTLLGSAIPTGFLTSTYYVRAIVDNVACPEDFSTEADVIVNAPTNVADVNLTENCSVTANDWIHIYNKTNGKVIGSINSGGQDLGIVTMKSYIHTDLSVNAVGPFCTQQQAVMDKSFVIESANAPGSAVDVRLYFTDAELADLIERSLTTQTTGGVVTSWNVNDTNGCEDNDDVLNINQLYVTQVSDPGNEDDIYDGTSGIITLHKPSNSGVGNSTFEANYVEFSVTGFSEFWIHGSESGVALPVELLNFEASVISNNSTLLNWSTLTEINNSGFEVERSINGLDFEKIKFVTGNGSTNEIQNYKLIDENLNLGVYYYRLKQIDFDGGFEYSNVVSAKIVGESGVVVSYFIPNPSSDLTTLVFNVNDKTNVQIEILDNLGRRVTLIEKLLNGGKESVNLNLNDYATGVYTAKVLINSKEYTRKLVVRK